MELEARDMLDVLHYFFEEDMFYSSAEQAEGRDRAREQIYRQFYGTEYAYSVSKPSSTYQVNTKNFDDVITEEEEEKLKPFDPLQKKQPTKPYVPPTRVNANSPLPFGDVLDGPMS